MKKKLYKIVALEIKNNEVKDGLWLKAFSDSLGDKTLAEAMYAKLRVSQLAQLKIEEKEHQESLDKEIKKALKKARKFQKF